MTIKKGQSGNPGGETKFARATRLELAALARVHCPRAIERAAGILDSEDERAAMMAATFLCDRGIGKPREAALDLTEASTAELAAELNRRLDAEDSDTGATPAPVVPS